MIPFDEFNHRKNCVAMEMKRKIKKRQKLVLSTGLRPSGIWMANNSSSLKNRKFHLGYAQFLRIQLPSLCKNWMACCVVVRETPWRGWSRPLSSSMMERNWERSERTAGAILYTTNVNKVCCPELKEWPAMWERLRPAPCGKKRIDSEQKFGWEILP